MQATGSTIRAALYSITAARCLIITPFRLLAMISPVSGATLSHDSLWIAINELYEYLCCIICFFNSFSLSSLSAFVVCQLSPHSAYSEMNYWSYFIFDGVIQEIKVFHFLLTHSTIWIVELFCCWSFHLYEPNLRVAPTQTGKCGNISESVLYRDAVTTGH